ncbi:MAG: hypothetical protein U0457_16100 [Candidatus Sericytochromatia bacterium]
MKNIFKLICSIAIILNLSQQAKALSISPYIVDIATESGKEGNKTIKVLNDSNTTYNLKMYAHDIGVDKNGKKTHFPPSTDDSVAKYVDIIPKNLVLKPNESKEVKVIIKTPENWKGGKQSIVFFDAKPEVNLNQKLDKKKISAKLELSLSLGALILNEVKGTTVVKSRIVKADIVPKKNGKKLDILLDVDNTGNTHVKASGFVSIFDQNEAFIGRVDLPNSIVLPGKTESLNSRWEGDKLKSGTYHALITYEFGDDKNMIIDKSFKID